jgi:ribosomal protein S18 acetylase RimI-like enzyme
MHDIPEPPAFALPEGLRSMGLSLRPETDCDLPFLMQVFASTRTDELTLVSWTPDQKRAFLVHQFGAQRHHYRTFYPDAAFDVIERNGSAIGRLYVDERQTRVHILDIALIPEARDGGIGTAILSAIQDYARNRGKGVDIFVERINPAKSLYDRMGFKVIREEEIYLEMDWTPDGVS